MTPTEQFVAELCKDTFLPFWSFPSPLGKKGKELCDLLVVCDPDIIIFSVKEIIVANSGNPEVDTERWMRKAIDASVSQIYGAERIIQLNEEITLSDGKTKITLPDKAKRNIYRVAVAFGRGEQFPLKYGDFGKGFVHVLDEKSVHILLRELDTVTDFIQYLKAQEQLSTKTKGQLAFAVEDYLPFYSDGSFNIPEEADMLTLEAGIWYKYANSDQYKKSKADNRYSYIWDFLIKSLYEDFYNDILLNKVSRNELELTIRAMNKESRFARRYLSHMLTPVFGDDVNDPTIKARIAKYEREGTQTYVFLLRGDDREQSIKELQLRCVVARSMFKDCTKVIGICSNPFKQKEVYGLDICYIDIPNWDEEFEAKAQGIKDDLGYFKSPNITLTKPS